MHNISKYNQVNSIKYSLIHILLITLKNQYINTLTMFLKEIQNLLLKMITEPNLLWHIQELKYTSNKKMKLISNSLELEMISLIFLIKNYLDYPHSLTSELIPYIFKTFNLMTTSIIIMLNVEIQDPTPIICFFKLYLDTNLHIYISKTIQTLILLLIQ